MTVNQLEERKGVFFVKTKKSKPGRFFGRVKSSRQQKHLLIITLAGERKSFGGGTIILK